jgi:hypothetical protein
MYILKSTESFRNGTPKNEANWHFSKSYPPFAKFYRIPQTVYVQVHPHTQELVSGGAAAKDSRPASISRYEPTQCKMSSDPLFNVKSEPESAGPSSEFDKLHISPVLRFLREQFLELRSRFCLRRHYSPFKKIDYGQLGHALDSPSELGFIPIRSKRSARLFCNPSSLLLRVFLAVLLYLSYIFLFTFVFFLENNNQTNFLSIVDRWTF